MNFVSFLIMLLISYIAVKYLIDMIKYAKGYEINGKCRYGKKYAAELKARKAQSRVENTVVIKTSAFVQSI